VSSNGPNIRGQGGSMPRYLIQRTVPPGILNEVTNETLQSIQATNSAYDVRWIHTYVNRDKTKTFCIYEGPSEEAVRLANARNNLSINQLDEIPDDMLPV
jgi:hypothetical protein